MKTLKFRFFLYILMISAGILSGGCEIDSIETGGTETLYTENFEGNVPAYYYDPGFYTPSLGYPGANGTNTCLSLSGGAGDMINGIYTDIGNNYQPIKISFYALSGSTTVNDAIFSVMDSDYYFVFMCWFNNSGNIVVRNNTGTQTATTYTSSTWYKIEFKNINWSARTYDFYVNGTLLLSGVTFWQNRNNIRFIQFGNEGNTTSALDEIRIL